MVPSLEQWMAARAGPVPHAHAHVVAARVHLPQGTFSEHSVNIQGTFREHSGNIQGTFGEYSGNIQGELSGRP
jgi:hypothetical protein